MNARKLLAVAGLVALAVALPALAKNPDPPNLNTNGTCPPECVGLDPLTPEVAATVIYMREEEKLARDVYLAFADLWGTPVFTNIAAAEQRHMDAVLGIINCFSLTDPVVDDTPGVFVDPVLGALYAQLVAAGTVSELDAFMAGATIEERDIVDLQAALAESDVARVNAVYENLLCGSLNHLRAFAKLIAQADATYTAQYLTQAEFDAIAASPPTPCGAPAGPAQAKLQNKKQQQLQQQQSSGPQAMMP